MPYESSLFFTFFNFFCTNVIYHLCQKILPDHIFSECISKFLETDFQPASFSIYMDTLECLDIFDCVTIYESFRQELFVHCFSHRKNRSYIDELSIITVHFFESRSTSFSIPTIADEVTKNLNSTST